MLTRTFNVFNEVLAIKNQKACDVMILIEATRESRYVCNATHVRIYRNLAVVKKTTE